MSQSKQGAGEKSRSESEKSQDDTKLAHSSCEKGCSKKEKPRHFGRKRRSKRSTREDADSDSETSLGRRSPNRKASSPKNKEPTKSDSSSEGGGKLGNCIPGRSSGRGKHHEDDRSKTAAESEDFDAGGAPRKGRNSERSGTKRGTSRIPRRSEGFDTQNLGMDNQNKKDDQKRDVPRETAACKGGSPEKSGCTKLQAADAEKPPGKGQQIQVADEESIPQGMCMPCIIPRKGKRKSPEQGISRVSITWEDLDVGRSPGKGKQPDAEDKQSGRKKEEKVVGGRESRQDKKLKDYHKKSDAGSSRSGEDQKPKHGLISGDGFSKRKPKKESEEDERGSPEAGDKQNAPKKASCSPGSCPKGSEESKEEISSKRKEEISLGSEAKSSSRKGKGIKEEIPTGRKEEVPFRGIGVQTEGNLLEGLLSNKQESETPPDYVLVTKNDKQFGKIIEHYLANLKSAGLQLQSVTSKNIGKTTFIKVQVPIETAPALAQAYGIRLSCLNPSHRPEAESAGCWQCLDTTLTSRNPKAEVYLRNRESVNGLQPKKATSAERIMIVHEILRATKFGDKPVEFGIEEIKSQGAIATAYPMHDGGFEWTKKGPLNDRQLLKAYWANYRVFCKVQPIELIKKYFGPEAAFYFALMGVYTAMLTPAAFLGVAVFLLGPDCKNSERTTDICENETITCPNCKGPKFCSYSMIKGACKYSYLNCMFDNDHYTMPFAVLMSFWCMVLLIIWERKERMMRVLWNLYSWCEEDPTIRADYLKKANTTYKSPITGKDEPCVSARKQMSSWLCSTIGVVAIILVLLVILCMLIFCRILIRNMRIRKYSVDHPSVSVNLRGNANITTAIICGLVNVVVVILLDPVLDVLAYHLTTWEVHRTQKKFDESYLMKLFVLKFVNNLNYVVYLALFRNIANVYPGNYNMWAFFFGINRDVCDVSGCITDVWISVFIIALIKPLFNFVRNFLIPAVLKRPKSVASEDKLPQWETDYNLRPLSEYHFAKLNIDLIVQYAFVICFTSVFQPLAFILWLYNLIELRINARWIVRYTQRPVPRQVSGKGIWKRMLYTTTLIAMVINALILGLTIDYFDRLAYYEEKNTMSLYMTEGRFTSFKTSLYDKGVISKDTEPIEECMYQGLRNASDEIWFNFNIQHYRSYYKRYLFTAKLLMAQYGILFIFFVLVPSIEPSVQQMVYYQERKQQLQGSQKK